VLQPVRSGPRAWRLRETWHPANGLRAPHDRLVLLRFASAGSRHIRSFVCGPCPTRASPGVHFPPSAESPAHDRPARRRAAPRRSRACAARRVQAPEQLQKNENKNFFANERNFIHWVHMYSPAPPPPPPPFLRDAAPTAASPHLEACALPRLPSAALRHPSPTVRPHRATAFFRYYPRSCPIH